MALHRVDTTLAAEDTEPVLTRTKRLLNFIGLDEEADGPDFILFGQTNEDTDEEVVMLRLDGRSFEDFGSPSKVTVTIVPGDQMSPKAKP